MASNWLLRKSKGLASYVSVEYLFLQPQSPLQYFLKSPPEPHRGVDARFIQSCLPPFLIPWYPPANLSWTASHLRICFQGSQFKTLQKGKRKLKPVLQCLYVKPRPRTLIGRNVSVLLGKGYKKVLTTLLWAICIWSPGLGWGFKFLSNHYYMPRGKVLGLGKRGGKGRGCAVRI